MTLGFGYVRASTSEEVKQGSNEIQKEALNRFFTERGWEFEIYEDKAKSGANMDRDEFKKMMKDVSEKKPFAVVVAKIDRYARSLIDLLNSINELERKGVGFISIQDSGIDTTSPNGRLLLQILGAFAEFERTMINSRTKAGREKALAKGVKFGRPSLRIKNGKYLDPKKIMELKNQGQSARAIAKFLGCSITPVLKVIKGEI